ncbi:MAG: ATP-binding protein [Chloroflexi bacterium]|nr:ATP-binding protein [Chloroflexota bacterium]
MNLKVLIEEVAISFEPILADRQQTLSLDLHEGPAWLEADRGRLIQVLSNIVSNASKYSEPGTDINLRWVVDGGDMKLSVVDRRRGMKPEDLSRLFTLFFRAPEVELSSTPGTGVGLYMSRKIVEMHGGEINVDSAYGVGTTVSVCLHGVTTIGNAEERGQPRFRNRLNDLPDVEKVVGLG